MLRSGPIARSTSLKRGRGLKRTGLAKVSPKQKAKNAVRSRFSRAVLKRAGGVCEVGAEGCLRVATAAHHKRLKSQGGSDHVSNGLAVCCVCHRYVHDNPEWSQANGFIEMKKEPQMASNTTRTLDDLVLQFQGNYFGAKFDYTKPFVRDGWKYVTDSRVAIRTPATGANDELDYAPPCHELPWPTDRETLLPWPAPVYDFVMDALAEDDEGDDVYGFTPDPEHIEIGNRLIASAYHYQISLLPNVFYMPKGDPKDPLFFQFDGGQGLLMPLNPDRVKALAREAAETVTA